jgi:hypothetical protein
MTNSSPKSGAPSHPSTDDPDAWLDHWSRLGQLWRREPEIGADRQRFLAQCCESSAGSVEHPPFKGIKLDRADVEWLLATYSARIEDAGNGQRFNLHGADLHGVNLESRGLRFALAEYMRDTRDKMPPPSTSESATGQSAQQAPAADTPRLPEPQGHAPLRIYKDRRGLSIAEMYGWTNRRGSQD